MHHYFKVDPDIIWDIAHVDLAEMIAALSPVGPEESQAWLHKNKTPPSSQAGFMVAGTTMVSDTFTLSNKLLPREIHLQRFIAGRLNT